MNVQPLTESEIKQLDEFLMSDAAPEASMDISMMDGFITEAVSSPNLITPTTAMRWIWDAENGKEAPRFANAKQANTISELVMRYWNHVAGTLSHATEQYEPLIMVRQVGEQAIPIIDEWCMGFCTGMAMGLEAWQPLLNERPEWFSTILLYGTEQGWEELEHMDIDAEQHEAFAESLADSVCNIYRYFSAQRTTKNA